MSQNTSKPAGALLRGQRRALQNWPKKRRLPFPALFQRLRGTEKLHRDAKAAFEQGRPAEGARLLKILAARRDRDALFELGQCYAEGRGVIRNMPEAVDWIRRAAELGHVDAQHVLGQIFSNGIGKVRDFSDPMRLYAGVEDVGPQSNHSLLFPAGINIERNEEEGYRWLERAAAAGHPFAQLDLAQRFLYGWSGGQPDIPRAVELLKASAKQDCSKAHVVLSRMLLEGKLVARDPKAGVEHLRAAAELGNPDAAGELGVLLASGTDVAADPVEAVLWFEKAVARNHSSSALNLANMCLRGQGCPQNFNKAAGLYRKAIKLGRYAQAQWRLGSLHESGRGVEQDPFEASELYRQAAEQGFAPAQFSLALLYSRGVGLVRNDQKAVEWFEKAAKAGHVQSCLNLSLLALRGRLGAPNRELARQWLDLARAHAGPGDQEHIQHVERQLE